MEQALKILIIDDDEVDRLLITRALKGTSLSYSITEKVDAASGINHLVQNNYDCVFLDYLLPGTDGLTFLKQVRAMDIKTPVVIVTSQGDEKIAVEMMKAGASDYVIKTQINTHSIAQILRNVIKLRDVDRQREDAELALKVSEARLAEAQKIARIGNWECSYKQNAVYLSDEVYRIFEIDKDTFTPTIQNCLALLHPDEIAIVQQTVRTAKVDDEISLDLRVPLKNGCVKFATAQAYLVLDDNQETDKIIGTIQDITARKLVEQELIEAKRAAEESTIIKETFLANMSHEIRTPMNAIIGFTKLLLQQEVNAEQKKYLDAIHYSGENLLVIINDILDLSKIQSGKLIFEESEFNLSETIRPMLLLLEQKAKERSIELIYEEDNVIPLQFKGDSVRLNQVLVNLIGNAIKFTENGYVKLQVKVLKYSSEDALVKFVVEDSGIGIKEDKLFTIFESFSQATNETTRKYGGTGLGLTIVKSIVELQKGTIKVNSKIGKGTSFTVQLPFKRSVAISQNKGKLQKHSVSDEVKKGIEGINVLLVEDNGVNQLLAKAVLKKASCNVTIAENGVIALDALKKDSFDIILMDIQMPEMDGYEATRIIRKELGPPYSEIPIMAITAHAMVEEIDKCIQAGMNDYISKPFDADELLLKMAALVKNMQVKQ